MEDGAFVPFVASLERIMIDVLTTLEEMKSFFFNTSYLWTAAYIFPLVFSYHDFLVLFVTNF
jgi:hypothetical protein